MGAIIQKGIKYGSGNDGFSPIVTVTDIENGHKVDVRDINGVKSFEVLNGADGIDAPCDGLMFTSLEELGLTVPVAVGEIFNAMPDNSMAIIACEDTTEHITDVPTHYGVLTIKKSEIGRFSIDYQISLASSPCNVKKWIGTLKGNDGTGLYWKELSAEPTFVTLNDIGLTADATFQDVIDKLPKGGSALLGVKDFTNYQTIFPYAEGNDQFARVYIVKGIADGSSMYARWFRKDGIKEAIAKFNIETNKFDGWQEIATKIYNSVAELNRAKGKNIELVNGEDNTQKIVDALSVGEQFVSFYHNNANQSRFGIDVSYGSLINEIRIVKCLDADLTSNYAIATAFMNTGCVMSRIYYKTYSTDWCVNGTITSLPQLGLTADATLDDAIEKLKGGQNATLSTKDFTNYQTLFPYSEEQDAFASVRIEKSFDTSRTIVTWVRKDGSKVAYGNLSSNNKVVSWHQYALKSYVDSKHKYSTTETAVGTWIDGKTIYRKTFTKSPTSNQSNGNQVTIDVATISGLTNVIDIQATAKLQNYNNTSAPIYAKIPFSEMWRSNSGSTGAAVYSIYVEGTTLKLHANSCTSDDIYYITVEYTK